MYRYNCCFRSVEPLLNENEYCNTKKIVEEFISENGPGPLLQSKLLKKYDNTDNWVNNRGFLEL